MTYSRNSIQDPARTKTLFMRLVQEAKKAGLEEERFSFKSLFMNKEFEGKAKVIDVYGEKLIIGEREQDGVTQTYVKLPGPEKKIIEWDASKPSPLFTVRSSLNNNSYETNDISIFDEHVQHAVESGLNRMKIHDFSPFHTSDVASNVARLVNAAEKNTFQPSIQNPEMHDYIASVKTKEALIDIHWKTQKADQYKEGEPLDVTYTVEIKTPDGKPVYDVRVKGISQSATTMGMVKMDDLQDMEMTVYQGQTPVEIVLPMIADTSYELGFQYFLAQAQETLTQSTELKSTLDVVLDQAKLNLFNRNMEP